MLIADTPLVSEESYQLFFEYNPQPMWVFDVEILSFLAVNEAATKIYGYTKDEFLSMTIKDIRPSEDIPALLDQLSKNDSDRYQGLGRHKKKGGTIIDVEVVWRPLVFEGRPAELVLINDVTERKRAEGALREAERKYRTIFENASEGIFQTTPDGKFITANLALVRMLGYESPEELMVADIEHDLYIDPRRRKEFKRLLEEKGSVTGFEVQHHRKDGSNVWLSESARAVRDDSGKILFYEGFCEDISERKRAEESLRESEGRYKGLVDSAFDGVVVHQDGIVKEANRAYAEMFGYSVEELIGRNILELTVPEQREFVHSKITGDDDPYEACGLKKDGTRINIEVSPTHCLYKGQRVRLAAARDITERKRIEEALRETVRSREESLALLDTILSSAPIGFAFHNRDLVFERINETLAAINGLPVEQHLGRTLRDVLPEIASGVESIFRRVLETGEPVLDIELKGETPADPGHQHYWLSSFYPVRIAGGEVMGVGVIVIDITERKRADERLQESERRFRQLAENINEVFWVVEANKGEMLYVSPAFEEIWGHTCQSLYERPNSYLESVHPEDKRKIEAAYKRQRQGARCEDEYRIVRPDGSIRWIHDRAFPIKDEAGKVIRIVGVAEDISKRKSAEVEMVRLVTAIEQTADSISITDTDGIIQYVNPAFERITGYTKEEVIGQTPRVLKSGKTEPEVYRELWATIKCGKVWTGQLINRRKDGSLYEEQVTISPIRDSSGEIINYVAVKQDITSRVQLEDQFRQAQKMESVGKLAGGVAHDFNNLLTVIAGYSDLTMRKLQVEDPLRRNVEEIKKAGDRAAGLTRQLLAFSRKQVLESKVLDLNSIVSDLAKMLQRLIGEDIQLQTSLESTLGRVKADPGQIEQVIMNLAVNARDAMPTGGKLTIETQNVYLDEEYAARHIAVTPGHYVLLAVSDTGCGMDDKTRQRIFDPFFTTKELGKGTGLGLSTVYGIIKQSGGSIWVYSEIGLGTTFKIYLPRLDDATEVYALTTKKLEIPKGTETILLAEDEEMVRKLARQILETCGYRVLEAPHGGAALLLCERYDGPIHLMLTDVVMPEMSGRDLVQRLSPLRPEMQVLFMSGYTEHAVVNHGVLEAETHFIQKPFSPDSLAYKVREVLDASFVNQDLRSLPTPGSHVRA